MEFVKKEVQDGRSVVTVEVKRIFRKPKQIQYLAESETVKGEYWSWLELPGKKLVPDLLSFQLDAWNRG